MLRLYGIELILKKREINRILSQPSLLPIRKCQMALFEELQMSKNMFLTFSPVLIEEIKKQYSDMLSQIKDKHAEKCERCKFLQEKKTKKNEEDEDPIDKIKKQL